MAAVAMFSACASTAWFDFIVRALCGYSRSRQARLLGFLEGQHASKVWPPVEAFARFSSISHTTPNPPPNIHRLFPLASLI